MAANISSIIDPDHFFIINSAIQLTLFGIFTLPTIILTGVCVVALLLATVINPEMRTVLINPFAAEICFSMSSSFIYLGYPVRAWKGDEVSCFIAIGITVTYACANLSSVILCAIMIHRFIKYGKDKLNWKIIIVSTVLLWTISFALGSLLYFIIRLRSSNGFCEPDMQRNAV